MAVDLNSLVNKKKIQMITIENKDRQTYPISFHINKNAKEVYVYFEDLTEDDIKNFQFVKSKDDLKIINGNQTYSVFDYFTSEEGISTKSKVTTIMYDDGNGGYVYKNIINEGYISTANYDTDVIYTPNKKGVVTGTIFSDEMDMYNTLENPLNSKNKGLTINGGKGNDVITGSKFDDTIDGGVGTTTYNYDFGKQSGQDTIKLKKGDTLILNLTYNETPLTCNEVIYGNGKVLGLGNDLLIYKDDMSNMIRLKNFFTTNATIKIGSENLKEFFISDNFEGINLSGKGKITGTIYNDLIQGSDKNDTITAKAGNDTIYTNGGKDTVVETGVYGHDRIDGSSSSKVTVKLSTFDSKNLTYGADDLTYTTDDNSSFVYSDFVSGETADLWIKAGNKSYHVVNDNSDVADYSVNKNNNVIFLNKNNQEFIGSKKGVNTIYSIDGANKYTLQGVNDTIVDTGADDDVYKTNLTKSTKLVISDDGGNDSLTISNSIYDTVLFYNVDKDGNVDDDLMIYNRKAMSYSALTKAYKADSYTGAVKLSDYFTDKTMETVSYVSGDDTVEFDMKGWKYLVNTYVVDWLNENKMDSVEQVLLAGTKSQKTALTNLFKNISYGTYLEFMETSAKYSEMRFENDNNILKIYKEGIETPIYQIGGFFEEGKVKSIEFLVKDDDGKLMTMSINSNMEVSLNLGNDNKVIYNEDYPFESQILKVAEGQNNTLVFEDKDYVDFYTKGELSGAYEAGDPLIYKDKNNLVIGDVTVKNIDGLNTNIQLVDKEGKTKNIIVGQGEINGTYDSEIIVGSNSVDIINSNGSNDLIYMGDGNDTLNMTKTEGTPDENTAEMIGIGGTHPISNNLTVPASSVYDSTGDDTYNTTLKEFGLYIEDYAGNDTLNIKYTDDNLMYFFDVVNPNHAKEKPTLYTDLMICDKSQFTTAGMSALSGDTSSGMKAMMESMQGTFGYVWIDDHFKGYKETESNQKIENINIIDAEGGSTALNIDSAISATKQSIEAWLSSDSGFFKPSQDFATAWDVIESGTKADKMYLASLYMF